MIRDIIENQSFNHRQRSNIMIDRNVQKKFISIKFATATTTTTTTANATKMEKMEKNSHFQPKLLLYNQNGHIKSSSLMDVSQPPPDTKTISSSLSSQSPSSSSSLLTKTCSKFKLLIGDWLAKITDASPTILHTTIATTVDGKCKQFEQKNRFKYQSNQNQYQKHKFIMAKCIAIHFIIILSMLFWSIHLCDSSRIIHHRQLKLPSAAFAAHAIVGPGTIHGPSTRSVGPSGFGAIHYAPLALTSNSYAPPLPMLMLNGGGQQQHHHQQHHHSQHSPMYNRINNNGAGNGGEECAIEADSVMEYILDKMRLHLPEEKIRLVNGAIEILDAHIVRFADLAHLRPSCARKADPDGVILLIPFEAEIRQAHVVAKLKYNFYVTDLYGDYAANFSHIRLNGTLKAHLEEEWMKVHEFNITSSQVIDDSIVFSYIPRWIMDWIRSYFDHDNTQMYVDLAKAMLQKEADKFRDYDLLRQLVQSSMLAREEPEGDQGVPPLNLL